MDSSAPAQDPVDSPGEGNGDHAEETEASRGGTVEFQPSAPASETSETSESSESSESFDTSEASAPAEDGDEDDDGNGGESEAEEPEIPEASETPARHAAPPPEAKVKRTSTTVTVPELDLSAHRRDHDRNRHGQPGQDEQPVPPPPPHQRPRQEPHVPSQPEAQPWPPAPRQQPQQQPPMPQRQETLRPRRLPLQEPPPQAQAPQARTPQAQAPQAQPPQSQQRRGYAEPPSPEYGGYRTHDQYAVFNENREDNEYRDYGTETGPTLAAGAPPHAYRPVHEDEQRQAHDDYRHYEDQDRYGPDQYSQDHYGQDRYGNAEYGQDRYAQETYASQDRYGRAEYGESQRREQGFATPYEPAPEERRRRGKLRAALITLLVLVLLVGGAGAAQILRPLPEPTMRLTLPTSSHTFPGTAPELPMSPNGQSVVHVEGLGTMASSGGDTPIPTASVAKVMTAYVFLKEHPLKPGKPGPTYNVSEWGVAQMPMRRERGESILGIKSGMRLTERKALEALMIVSANDVAHELARWDAGTLPAFVRKMNREAKALGMTRTTYTDPSGYHPGTVSTAADQVKLLRAAMRIPAFAEIVSKRTYVPHDGTPTRPNGNILLGEHGVIGGKTGYTDVAGGNFVFAARRKVGGSDVLMLGAVMGQRTPSAIGAIEFSGTMLAAAQQSMSAVTLARAGTQVGTIADGLGGRTPVRADSDITVVGWPGLTVKLGYKDSGAAGLPHTGSAGTKVGTLDTGRSDVPLVLGTDLREPAITKRLTRTDFDF